MATLHPEDELARLQKLVQKGLPPLVVVTGTNDFFRAEAMELLLPAIPAAAELRVLDAVDERGGGGGAGVDDDAGGDDDADGGGTGEDAAGLAACPELQDLRGGGLFAKTAFLVVRRASAWWQRHAVTIAAQVPKFGKGCGLVLESPKLDRRKKVAATLVKQLAEAGALFEFRDLYELPYDRSRSPVEGELAKWVARRASRLGVALTPDAAWLLVAQVGKQPAELVAELGRLRDRLGADGKRKPLGPEDLRGHVTCSFESTPFELAEAVLGGDRRRALRSVQAMFDRGVRSKDGKAMDIGGLLPFTTAWLYQSLASAYEGRILLDSGVSARDLPGRVGVRQFPERYVEQVQRLDAARLQRGLLALHHCQRMSRLTGEDPDALLERFLAQWFDGVPVPSAQDLEL
jgi:DNA polymerase III delta subunit